MKSSKNKSEKKDLRNRIAIIVTASVMGVTVLIAIFCLIIPLITGGDANMDFIGQSLLPLWGTWVGTVLAFYFSKENFEAASKSYQEAIQKLTPEEKIASIPVTDIMKTDIEFTLLDDETLQKQIKKDFLDNKEYKHNRFIFLDSNNIIKYVIHRSVFNQFIVSQLAGEINIDELTLENVINCSDSEIHKALDYGYGYGIVSQKSNLLEVKRLMDLSSTCCDVFITQNGNKNEPIIGLITDKMIFEHANV
jgi:hypothetical protein